MPVCHVCDAVDDFHDEDGLYYCNVCNTQSQSMQVLEQEDPYAGASGGRFNMSQSMLAVKVSAKPRKELNVELAKTKPWWSFEAFQIILRAQVDLLIAQGVSKQLSEVVKTIWFKYLQMSGVAFCSTSKQQMSAYRKMVEERQLEVRVRAESKVRARRKKLAEDKRSTSAADAKDGGSAKPEGIDSGLDTEENINTNSEATDSDVDALSVKSYSSAKSGMSAASSRKSGCTDRHTINIRKQAKSESEPRVGILSLKHLVCFLYLGLRYLKEPIIMSDLQRWISAGLLPYFGTEDVLPQYMVASMGSSELRQFLNRDIPSLPRLEKLWRSLTTFLHIENLPPVDIRLLISRFLLDLNLPREIHALTQNLVHRKLSCKHIVGKRKGRQMEHPSCEGEALGFIFIALKLCFHLDDKFEHKQSAICRKIQQCCDASCNYFVWDEWVLAQKLRCQEQQMTSVPTKPRDVLKLRNLKSFIDFEKNTYRKWLAGETSYQAWTSNKMETRVEMMKPFLALSDDTEARPTKVRPSTFVHLHPNQDSSAEVMKLHISGVSYYTREAILSKDFSVTSLEYVSQSAIKSVGGRLLEDQQSRDDPSLKHRKEHWQDSQQDSGGVPNQVDFNFMAGDLLECVPSTTDEEPVFSQSKMQSGTKRTWSQIRTLDCYKHIDITDERTGDSIGERSAKCRKGNLTESIKRHTCRRLQKKLKKMSRDHSYIIYPEMKSRNQLDLKLQADQFHYSYIWLLKHLSKLIGQKFDVLRTEVNRLEKALCLDKELKESG
ncbi:TATA box-binding protein-associated factor RNA polymerase I subunit B-like [Anneissia japonica]|uniref:TATA box-binding protein-associated factor RNA polymerase I subunit B-like n=1 Tax=Anneissia japonica TaxID=1529436 RepID=UPI0014255E2F|nr:TATA box-binding protein-associated factor RNA polymerase I subunit B-like [Anneissia japonica]